MMRSTPSSRRAGYSRSVLLLLLPAFFADLAATAGTVTLAPTEITAHSARLNGIFQAAPDFLRVPKPADFLIGTNDTYALPIFGPYLGSSVICDYYDDPGFISSRTTDVFSSSDFTIEAWVMIYPGEGGNHTLLASSSSPPHPNSQVRLGLNYTRAGAFLVLDVWSDDGSVQGTVQSPVAYYTGPPNYDHLWNHLALRKTGTNWFMYQNGVQVAASSTLPNPTALHTFYVGRALWLRTDDNNEDGGYPWQGYVDELRMWNADIGEAAITAWMFKPITSEHPSYANLRHYYQFEEASGADAVDAGLANNTLTAYSDPGTPLPARDTLGAPLQLFYSAVATGLTPGTYYECWARFGASGKGAEVDFATIALPPVIVDAPVIDLHPTMATVRVDLIPNTVDEPTYVTVQYGLTTNYERRVAGYVLNGLVQVSHDFDLGPQPGNSYHYRVVSTNSGGFVYGPDLTFVAPAAAPILGAAIASNITASAAVLTTMVNPEGAATTVTFFYGLDATYGASVTLSNVGSGNLPVLASASVNGLTPGTSYHLRAEAQNRAGTILTPDTVFTTQAGAPTVVTQWVVGVSASNAVFEASVHPGDQTTAVWVEWGATTNYGSRTATNSLPAGGVPAPITATAGGLQAATSYHFRTVAQNNSGLFLADDAVFSTVGPPLIQNELVTDITTNSATLHASVNPGGLATAVYFVFGVLNLSDIATNLPPVPTPVEVAFPMADLVPGVSYYYRVVATNAAGTAFTGDTPFTAAGTFPCGRLEILGFNSGTGQLDLQFQSAGPFTYMIESSQDLAHWGFVQPFNGQPIGPVTVHLSIPPGQPATYYRLECFY